MTLPDHNAAIATLYKAQTLLRNQLRWYDKRVKREKYSSISLQIVIGISVTVIPILIVIDNNRTWSSYAAAILGVTAAVALAIQIFSSFEPRFAQYMLIRQEILKQLLTFERLSIDAHLNPENIARQLDTIHDLQRSLWFLGSNPPSDMDAEALLAELER